MSAAAIAPAAAAPAAPAAAEIAPVEKAPEPKAAEPEPVFELEIDGKKETLTHTQARTRLQKSGAVDKRMQETAEAKKKLDELLVLAETDTEEFLRRSKKDPEKILQALLARKAKLELMTPEQREKAALEAERDALKADKEKRDKEAKEAADKAMDEQTSFALEEQLIAAAEKYGLDKTPLVLEGLCDVANDLMDYGTIPTIDQVVQEYMRRDDEHFEERDRKLVSRLKGEKLKTYLKANASLLMKLPAAELLEVLGADGVKAFQAATLTRVPGPGAAPKPKPPPIAAPPRGESGRYISEKDFDKKFRR